MQNINAYVGIDISKSYFDVAIPNNKGYSHHKLDNNQTGFSDFLNSNSAEIAYRFKKSLKLQEKRQFFYLK